MNRNEAEQIVMQHVAVIDGGAVVSHADAKRLIGEERFAKMMRDPIRNLPRGGEWIYFWNVLDYAGWPVLGSAEYKLVGNYILGSSRLMTIFGILPSF